MQMLRKLWQDDAGIVALEYLLVASIIGLGLVVGLSNVEIALDTELTELANAITGLDQSYSFIGVEGGNGTNWTSYRSGSCVIDSAYGSQTVSSLAPASCYHIFVGVP
jgi:Flp pilus assembly pilin Flp